MNSYGDTDTKNPWHSYKLISDQFLNIEKNIHLETFKYKGVEIWPLFRFYIFNKKVAAYKYTSDKSNKVKNGSSVIKTNISNLLLLITRLGFLAKDIFILNKLKKIDILFYKRSSADRNFEKPLESIFEKNYRCVNLVCKTSSRFREKGIRNTVFLESRLIVTLIQYFLIIIRKIAPNYNNYSELGRQIEGVTTKYYADWEMPHHEIISMIESFLAWKYYFLLCFSLVKPKAVFFVGYYNIDCMALISVCKSLNIKTVDIQHGKIGRYQPGYTHWNSAVLSRKGYILLPNYYWLWSENCKLDMMKWVGDGIRHIPIVGGYPWLSGRYDSKSIVEKSYCQNRKREYENYSRVILVTLQNVVDNITTTIIQAMSNSPESWIWLFRFHPGSTTDQKQNNIEILSNAQANVQWDYPSEAPLFDLLPMTDYHVTLYSSTCIEALNFIVPSIVIDEIGLEIYNDYIKKGMFGYAKNGKELVLMLKENPSSYNIPTNNQYIETSDYTAIEAVKNILEGK